MSSKTTAFILLLFTFSCYKKKKYFIPPVTNFEISRYLGTWHEIARTDNSFERGCINVTADYKLRKDGGIDVLNECLQNGKHKQAEGRAYFKSASNIASFKVTFLWPFYGNYYVIYIDKSYSHAIVYGGSPEYIWILAREKTITKDKLEFLLSKIKEFKLDPESLIIN